MTPERWQQIKEIFESSLHYEGEERSGFLASACAGDEPLRQEVESLIASHEKDGSFIDSPAYEAAAEMLLSERDLKPGQKISHYKILSTLGKGGMGEVYLARDTRLDRNVALKFLPDAFSQDQDRLRRFEQEARAASALNHHNILTIHEIGQVSNRRFIATEFVDGETLRERMIDGPMKIADALKIAEQIASALAEAHAAGIIHRDIKPENIILRHDGIVKVLDFGLAKLMEKKEVGAEDATRQLIQTSAGVVMGTVAYMSPEQARGLAVDARTDIWSLGTVLYEMLAGRAAFEGPTTSDLIVSVLEREPPPLGNSAETPAELQRIVAKMLRKDREERYQLIRDVLLDLQSLREEAEFEGKLKRSTAPKSTATATDIQRAPKTPRAEYLLSRIRAHKLVTIAAVLVLTIGITAFYYFTRGNSANKPTGNETMNSIAVLPFVNVAQDPNIEYLSYDITESVSNRLSRLSGLTVFRYKGKEQDGQKVGNQLNARVVLTGSVKQDGDQLLINVSLDDAKDNHRYWGEQYRRRSADVLGVQNEIAQEVAARLGLKLTRRDEQQLAKRYTNSDEAYQLYAQGRYYAYKLTPSETLKGVSYFLKAIEIDPSYALAYVGLADAYRSLPIASEMPAAEFPLKAKAAAEKAIELDDTLAEAHSELGFIIFWYDWNWSAAETQCRRALELDPNSADAHMYYAHLLSSTARHAEALAEIRRARELDPLNLRTNALEGQFLIHAGQTDEALSRLQKIFEREPNFWLAHLFAASAYIEKGRFAEAVGEAHKARELSGASTHPIAFGSYALAKWGKPAEARAGLAELMNLSKEGYVSPYNIALVHNGLGDRDETLAWLEQAYEQRDARMVFLKVEPKWNNLREDARFQDLLRRVGF
jgi:serine/threonine protein kinase/Flp pilus assembly protein TadD